MPTAWCGAWRSEGLLRHLGGGNVVAASVARRLVANGEQVIVTVFCDAWTNICEHFWDDPDMD
jgi:hypothetical protein